jgi:signal peptidase I
MRNSLLEWVFNFIVLIFATSTVAQPFIIPSGSMENTLMTGDHVIVDKLAYSPSDPLTKHLLPYEEVKRGDIVVFRYPLDIRQTFVKRVVGAPGDRIHFVDKQLFRNGERIAESYTHHISADYVPYRDDFPSHAPGGLRPEAQAMLAANVVNGEFIVPPGRYLALGDNRENSDDSRFWGLVPRENIIGKPVMVYWSYDAPMEDLTEFSVHHAVDLAEHFFSKTRWDRTLRPVRP